MENTQKNTGSHRRSWAEIDLGALRHNAALALKKCGSAILAVVKANAYGHGAIPVAKALESQVTLFGVANLREAEELRQSGVNKPILLLGACIEGEEEPAIKAGFHVCLSTLEEAKRMSTVGERLGREVSAHLALDTGMGRMGFLEENWTNDMVSELLAIPGIQWEGISSHQPSPDEDEVFSADQIERFRRIVADAEEMGFKPKWRHLANSGGILGYEATHQFCNLARPGLMLYGVSPIVGWEEKVKLVLTWKTRVLLVRELPAGHGVSYGRTFITERSTKVATLATGYADGYPRQVSGRGASVLIQGIRCPLLGRVTMDQIMVDVTDLPEPVRVGEEAVLLGRQGNEVITTSELAEKAYTIPWHIFTSLGMRVNRVYVEDAGEE